MMIFFKKYRNGLLMTVVAIVQYFLFVPIHPSIPDKGELHEITGMPRFHKYLAGRSSGMHFKVDGMLIHCSFTELSGGLDGCDQYDEFLDQRKFVRATWFWMTTRYGAPARMLHTVEQDGVLKISANETYGRRMTSYKGNKETTLFLNLLWIAIAAFFFYRDWCDASKKRKMPARTVAPTT